MRAMSRWSPTWKSRAIASILQHRQGTFVDVGANVGQTLLDFLSSPDRSDYMGFEPNLACAKHLSDFISANALQSCVIICAALGERTGIADFYSSGSEVDAGATIRESLRPALTTVARKICVFRMDDVREHLAMGPIALVKIDVEGSEVEVLRGMARTLKDTAAWVLCEVLHRDASADPQRYAERLAALTDLLGQLGYEALRIVQTAAGKDLCGLEPIASFPNVSWRDGSEVECDYLFVPAGQCAEACEVLAR